MRDRGDSKRATFWRLAALAALAAVTLVAWWVTRPGAVPGSDRGDLKRVAASPGAKVIIYLIDTLRADRLGAYGYGRAATPNLDALATESVLFERAYAAGPWTVPSVASLVTSTWPCEHDLNQSNRRLKARYSTLAERLQSAGYRTATFYNNLLAGPLTGLDRGYETAVLRESGDADVMAGIPAFLDEAGSEPFLLSIHTMEPHQPFYAPYEFTRRYGHVAVEDKEQFFNDYFLYRTLKFADFSAGRPPGATDRSAEQDAVRARLEATAQTVNDLYDGSVSFADANVGKVIADLKRRGLWEKSLFIVLSDHGEELGEHGDWFHDQSVYDELMHVPLLIKLPGGALAGTRVGDRVSLVDVLPTILDAVGQEPCAGCRGTSLLEVLDGTAASRSWVESGPGVRLNRSGYYRPARELRGDVNVALRLDAWKAIWNPDVETLELYDLATDPGEKANVAAAQPEIAREMRDEAIAWLEQCTGRASGPDEVVELDERTREQLRAIGYLQ